MRLTVIRFLSTRGGRRLLLGGTLGLIVLLVVGAVVVIRSRDLDASQSPLLLAEAHERLSASGCKFRVEAMRASLPFDRILPGFIADAIQETQCHYVVLATGSQLTTENVQLLNRYPSLSVFAEGDDVTDAVIISLARITNLKKLYLDHAATTDAGLTQLGALRPDIRIVLGKKWD